jgi:hypothetical protein
VTTLSRGLCRGCAEDPDLQRHTPRPSAHRERRFFDPAAQRVEWPLKTQNVLSIPCHKNMNRREG